MSSLREKKSVHWIILISLAVIWGSSFILMKRGLESFPSEQVAALRIFISFIFLLPVSFRYLPKVERKFFLPILAVGVFGNGIPAFLFTKAQTGISSALTGMLNSLTPLFTLILGVMVFHIKVKRVNVIGIIIGFIGALGLILAGEKTISGNIFYGGLVVIATLCYAVSVNVIKHYLQNVPTLGIASLAFLFVGPLAGAYLFTTNFSTIVAADPNALNSLGFISILAVFGTALSVIVFNVLIQQTNALFASSVTYLIPVVAIMWGLFENERIHPFHYLSIVVILLGVYLVNKKENTT